MAKVVLDKVSKSYTDVVAVEGSDINIEDGEFVTFVGPSGCGKTTTLETIAGLTIPSGGNITIGDEEVTKKPPKDRDIAMVFQNIALFPHMNVYENISYGLRLRNEEKEEIDKRVKDAVEILQIEGTLDRMPSELSGGQRQRVAIGRAIVRDPAVFLMDEPLANLDAKLRNHMRTELQRIQKQLDVTTIYVTHDQEEAMSMSDKIVVMNDGVIQQIAPPLECYHKPANLFVAGFIGSPAMNFINGSVKSGKFISDIYGIEMEAVGIDQGEKSDLILGIRPEDLHLSNEENSLETIEVEIDVLEPLGNEILAYLYPTGIDKNKESSQLLMTSEVDSDLQEGNTIEIGFDNERIHYFDGETGDAIQHGRLNQKKSIQI